MNQVLREFSFPEHALLTYKKFVGDGAKILVQRALPATEQRHLNPALARYRELYHEGATHNTQPYEGVLELLCELDRRGHLLGVLTNKPEAAARKLVAHLFAEIPWVYVAGQKDGMPTKPDPTRALHIAALFSPAAEQIFFVGDTDVDMQTARRAAMVPVGVRWGFRDEAELWRHGARHVLGHPLDLLKLLA